MTTQDNHSDCAVSAFDAWAEYYDLLHQGLEGEAEFYVGQAARIGGKILEIGCGTGRLAIPMALCGLDVVGVDNSAAMLGRCREKLAAIGQVKGSLQLVQQDMAKLDLGARFDFIAMAYRTFMHLLMPDDQRRCLLRVREHLNPGGTFIMNTWLPNLRPLLAGPRRQAFQEAGRHEVDGGTLVHHVRTGVDEFRQLLIEEHRIQELDLSGRVVSARVLPMVRAWTSYRELSHLYARAGFTVRAVFGNFDATPLSPGSTEMIWVLRSPP
jgi:SAM-dependent methyltransferase